VVRGRARLVGTRVDADGIRGWVSPVEARLSLGLLYDDPLAAENRYLERATVVSDLGVLLRAAVARPLASRTGGCAERRPWIVSAAVDNVTVDEALEAIFTPPSGPHARIVTFVHPHALNLAVRDRALSERLAQADMTLPDGVGIRIAGRMLGIDIRHNLNGTDLRPRLLDRAAALGVPIALVGGSADIVADSAERLAAEHTGLEVALASHGYLSDAMSRDVASRIRSVGRCLVLVGMGTPRQEAWVWTYLRNIPQVTAVTVGGLFDFVSGRIPRAPVVWRELGLEWLYRLSHEPRRLGRRYLVGNPVFLARVARQRLRRGW
jgi:N-acetylglucosaminyldiphosphoundecaprenol N-acetyl-beta-D-mannosaminyltransferase